MNVFEVCWLVLTQIKNIPNLVPRCSHIQSDINVQREEGALPVSRAWRWLVPTSKQEALIILPFVKTHACITNFIVATSMFLIITRVIVIGSLHFE